MKYPSVVIIEDEWIVAEELKLLFEANNCTVIGQADNAIDGKALILEQKPDLIIIDIKLKGETDGIDLASQLIDKSVSDLVFLTSYGDPQTRKRAERLKPLAFLDKPFPTHRIAELLSAI
mgnify:CR=1 FL=1